MGAAYIPAQWSNFFFATASAAAALTGLIFVAVSMHLRYIVKDTHLRTGAGITLFGIILSLLISLETMIPGQRRMALGIEIVTTLTLWFGMWFRVATRSRRELGGIPDLAKRRLPFSYTFFMLMFVGGIGLFTHSMGGLYLVAPGDVLCMLIAVQNAWFFLTEIGIDEEEEIKEEKAELDMIRDAVEEREAKSN